MLLSRQPATLESLRCTLDNEYEKVARVEVVLLAPTYLLFSTLIVGEDKKKKKQITVVEYFTLTSYTCHKILQFVY